MSRIQEQTGYTLHSSEHKTLTDSSISDATTEQSVSSCKQTNLMGTMGTQLEKQNYV
jgi:hypothetical protein